MTCSRDGNRPAIANAQVWALSVAFGPEPR